MIKKHFVRGLVFITPIGVTVLIMLSLYEWVFEKIHNVNMQGITLLIVTVSLFICITLLGYLGSTFLIKPIGQTLEKLISKIPLISFIYSSIKDLSGAFMGDKKKFDQPIIVNLDKEGVLKKPGFITRKDLSSLGLEEHVAVYLPHSYNFSGNVFFTETKNITLIENISSGEFMKLIVSGGVSGDITISK
jgi:uncharacterized membrane protein